MQDKGDNAKAKAVYQQVVKQYPNTEAAKQAQNAPPRFNCVKLTRYRWISGLNA